MGQGTKFFEGKQLQAINHSGHYCTILDTNMCTAPRLWLTMLRIHTAPSNSINNNIIITLLILLKKAFQLNLQCEIFKT